MRPVSLLHRIALCCAALACGAAPAAEPPPGANPVLRDRFTADPAPLVVGDTVYLYVGRDEAKGDDFFLMKEWLGYSSKDLRHWTAHGPIMKPTDFKWAVGDAWAAQVVQRNGRFYFYTTVQHDDTRPGKAIGVAEGGILSQSRRDIEVWALPNSIPEKIEADVSHLKIAAAMHVNEVKLPAGVELKTTVNYTIAVVSVPEKEEAAPVAAAAVAGAPAAAGAAAPAAGAAADAKGAAAPAADAKGAAAAPKKDDKKK